MASYEQLKTHINLISNVSVPVWIENSIIKGEGSLGPNGELVVLTGKQTGRSANDKYVVDNETSHTKAWWENNLNRMSDEDFAQLESDVCDYLLNQEKLFHTTRSIGSKNHFALGIDLVSSEASAALFSTYMFKESVDYVQDNFRIIHAPNFQANPQKYNTRSEIIVVTCFQKKMTIITGTRYAGEIKKSMFSIMNFLLPDVGILPMHSGANQNAKDESFVFFGLSGTGKTTLSTDEGLLLIGDDEHGLSGRGLFNFEGGCYAKTFKLALETEPGIFKASSRFASSLENVKLSREENLIDFFNDSITENGRSSYPLSFIEERVPSGEGKVPGDMFYLTADAFGVLPPVSLLTAEQAMDYFKLGYSAKLAGTEVGVKTPVATFSPCFGAPFMLRHPEVYSALLKKLIEDHNIRIWLINTGWTGGGYGKGKRFPISVTRSIIRGIQSGNVSLQDLLTEPFFSLRIPKSISGVDEYFLNPVKAWRNEEDYAQEASKLAENFKIQLQKLKN